MDPVATGRIEPRYNEFVLPFFQNRDFLGTNFIPGMQKKDYLTRYRQMKTDLEIETATNDMLDPFLINSANKFKGDYHTPYENMTGIMMESSLTLPQNSKPRIIYGKSDY